MQAAREEGHAMASSQGGNMGKASTKGKETALHTGNGGLMARIARSRRRDMADPGRSECSAK